MSLPERNRFRLSAPVRWSLSVLAVGLLASGLLALNQHRINQDIIAGRFERQSERLADSLSRRLHSYEYGLRGLRGVAITAGEQGLSRKAVSRYNESRDIDTEYPGARGFGFIRRVPQAGKDAFLAAARREDPGFRIKSLGAPYPEHFVIQYIEPIERNRQAIGLDVASEANRRVAALGASRSGRGTISAPITLLQAQHLPQRSFLILLPVFREGMPTRTPAQREAATFGWTYAPIASDEVIRAVELDTHDLSLSISDVDDEGRHTPFYRSPNADAGLIPGLRRQVHREVLGRQWMIETSARTSITDDLNLHSPWWTFAIGVLGGLLLSALSYVLAVGRRRERQEFARRARHSALVENSVDAIIGESLDGRVTSWNPGAERMFGFSADEAIGRTARELIVPDEHAPEEARILHEAAESRTVMPFESIRRRKDGGLLDVSIAAVPLFDDGGRLKEMAKTIRDISPLKAAERELRGLNNSLEDQILARTDRLRIESQRLDNILSGTNAGTWGWQVQTGEFQINERWAGMLGYTLEELHPVSIETWERLVHPEDLPRAQDLIQRHFRAESSFYELEVRMRHRDGHWVWVLTHGKVSARTSDGRPEWMHGIHMDVTETHILLDRLRDSETLLETIGAMVGIGGWQWEMEKDRLYWTLGCKRIHEVAPDYQPALDAAFDFYPPEARALLKQAAEKSIAEGCDYDLELPFVTAKGRPLWVRLIGHAETQNGRTVRLIGVIQDVTTRREAEDELKRTMRLAETANLAKSTFLANTSHEIRTPLNAMIGLSHLLQQTHLDKEQQSLLAKIQLASRSLLGVVNDVLDLSKIEAGEMTIESAPLDLCELLRQVGDIWRPQAESKSLSLRVEVPSERHCFVLGDAVRLRQILNNLMGNAVKFTEHGSIALSGEVLEETGNRLLVRLTVRDTGIGIPADRQAQLFQPFTQIDASTTRKYGGTGLGLSIVKHLTNLMGGEAGVESRPGEGSTFWIRLPLRVVDREQLDEGRPMAIGVLIACADPNNRNRLAAMARALGWKAETAQDAGEALTLLERRGADTLVVDAAAVESSKEMATAFRELHQRVPTVLLADPSDVVRLEQQGVLPVNDGILPKPMSSSELFNMVHAAIIRRGGDHDRLLQSTPIEATGSLWLPDVRVLVVDDSDINLEVAQRILEREGAVVTCAGNGAAALELLRHDAEAFDIVLMDVQMPVMDGNEATARIRGELGLTRLPVIALTAGALVAERQRSMDAGMNDFISKPIDPNSLIQRVRAHVERFRGAALPLVPRKPSGPAGKGWPKITGIDEALAAARIGDDWPLFSRMLKRLLRDSEEFTTPPADPMLADEAHRRDMAARLHKLRGNAGLLGAMDLFRLAGEAEAHCREARLSPLRGSMESLAAALRILNASAELAFGTAEPATGEGLASPTGHETIMHIRDLLAVNDLEAVVLVRENEGGLRSLLGREEHARLQDAVEELDFEKALALLSEV